MSVANGCKRSDGWTVRLTPTVLLRRVTRVTRVTRIRALPLAHRLVGGLKGDAVAGKLALEVLFASKPSPATSAELVVCGHQQAVGRLQLRNTGRALFDGWGANLPAQRRRHRSELAVGVTKGVATVECGGVRGRRHVE